MNDKTTKTLIINSARTLFMEKGYEHTPVEEICELSGMAKGTFFYHFETKQYLVMFLLDAQFSDMMVQIKKVIRECKNVEDKLTAFVMALISTDAIPPEAAQYFCREPEWFFKLYDDARYKYFFPEICEILREGEDTGAFRLRNTEMVANMLFLGINSFLHTHYNKMREDMDFRQEALSGMDELISKALGLRMNVLRLSQI
jgi:AcrR family transcriptional regulator